jgi:hypothetical protein
MGNACSTDGSNEQAHRAILLVVSFFCTKNIVSLSPFHGYPQYIQGLNTTASLNTLIEHLTVAHPELLMSQFLT